MMLNRLLYLIISATSLGLSGCNATQTQSVEALLAEPSINTRERLEKSIGEVFNSQPVKLADKVFTVSSTVLIERAQGSNTMAIDQRGLTLVDSFTLLLVGKACVLRHDQSNKLVELPNISCKAR